MRNLYTQIVRKSFFAGLIACEALATRGLVLVGPGGEQLPEHQTLEQAGCSREIVLLSRPELPVPLHPLPGLRKSLENVVLWAGRQVAGHLHETV